MDTCRFDSIEARYCDVEHTRFATGEQLLYLLESGWEAVAVGLTLYNQRARRIRVFVFTLLQAGELAEVAVVSTPAVENFALRIASTLAARQRHTFTREDFVFTA